MGQPDRSWEMMGCGEWACGEWACGISSSHTSLSTFRQQIEVLEQKREIVWVSSQIGIIWKLWQARKQECRVSLLNRDNFKDGNLY